MNTYIKDGRHIFYVIVRKHNKNAYFRVKEGILHITCHPKTSMKAIESFIDLKFDTFYQKINESSVKEADDIIMLWGKSYTLILTKGRFHYELSEDVIYVKAMNQDIEHIKKRIYGALLLDKISEIKPEIENTVRKLGINPCPIKIKYLKSKFGSYHKKNHEITLNSFLTRLDPIYLTYVMYHEYAHAKVFNHSKDFYHVLDLLMPNHRIYQKGLKKIAIH
jgi:predicted metal-dependent hydrolase